MFVQVTNDLAADDNRIVLLGDAPAIWNSIDSLELFERNPGILELYMEKAAQYLAPPLSNVGDD